MRTGEVRLHSNGFPQQCFAASREIAVEHSQNYWHAHNRALLDKLFA
jgi:hypothetical protein